MTLFDEIAEILFVSHRKESHSREQTVDRVFRKGLTMSGISGADVPAAIGRRSMTVSLETRQASDLLPLVTRRPKSRVSKKVRHYRDVPVIVCLWRGKEHLIDGNRRVHYLTDLGLEAQVYLCKIN